jgi:hypothetical protein
VAVNPEVGKYGTEALEDAAERVRTHAEQQEERLQARLRATRYAEQTDGLLVLLQFPDGPLRWTVFKSDEHIAAFPPYDGDLHEALKHHVTERIAHVPGEDAGGACRRRHPGARRPPIREWRPRRLGHAPRRRGRGRSRAGHSVG